MNETKIACRLLEMLRAEALVRASRIKNHSVACDLPQIRQTACEEMAEVFHEVHETLREEGLGL